MTHEEILEQLKDMQLGDTKTVRSGDVRGFLEAMDQFSISSVRDITTILKTGDETYTVTTERWAYPINGGPGYRVEHLEGMER
jgi:hypothetical protein